MATPQWTGRQSLAQPNINPTAAIAGASRAFGNISDTIQKEELAKQAEAYRQQQLAAQQDQFAQQQGLREDQFLFNKGAADRATQARIAEESRQKGLAANRYKIFDDKIRELDNAQLESFSLSPDTYAALQKSGLNDDQISALEDQAKQKNSDLFLDRNKTLSGVMDHIASSGEDLSQFAPLFESYKTRNGMGGVDENTRDFAQKLALENMKAGRSGGGNGSGSGGTNNDTNFARNVNAINDEELFRNGSDAWYKDWFPGENTKVYKQDVTRIAEHALANNGIRPMYVAQAIKADMDSGQTSYNLADIATDPSNRDYQSIVTAAKLMQDSGSTGNPGSAGQRRGAAPGEIGSAEFALSLGRGYQPVTRGQRQNALMDMAKSEYPQLFSNTDSSAAKAPSAEAQVIENVVNGNSSASDIPKDEKYAMLLSMAKKASTPAPEPGNIIIGPYGQAMPVPARKTPEQKELASLVRIMEQKPKELVPKPNTAEYKLFPERYKDPNPKIKAENTKLKKEQEKAYEKAFKLFSGEKEQKPKAAKKEEKVLSQNDIIRARHEERAASLAALLSERQNR